MRHNYVPAPRSIYQDVFKVAPGHFAEFSSPTASPKVTTFWNAHEVATRGLANPFTGSDQAALEQAEFMIGRAVSSQLISDVPLGAFLSGGIDSSLIVALMQATGRARAKTFTIGFSEKEYDEAVYAKKVAAHLGTDHTELYVTPEEARAVIPLLPEIYDEPFADSSQIPTYLVSKLARGHVTVSLSGDAGDELFGGYTRYLLTARIWKYLSLVPRSLRRKAVEVLSGSERANAVAGGCRAATDASAGICAAARKAREAGRNTRRGRCHRPVLRLGLALERSSFDCHRRKRTVDPRHGPFRMAQRCRHRESYDVRRSDLLSSRRHPGQG